MQQRDESQGSGMGLSLVRKTVLGNAATLVIDSAPAARRGTTFILNWKGNILD